jgi:general secretion pathway protein J
MKQLAPVPESGFTLVEMLVALSIFAVLAAAGVGLLRSSVDTQNAVATRVSGSGGLARLQALLASDVAHAVAPSSLLAAQPAFVGSSGGFNLLRSGWDNPDGAPRSDIQQVEWAAASGAVARSGTALGERSGPQARVLSAPQARFRYRAGTGIWTDSFASTPPEPLPQAVELVVTPAGRPPVTIILPLPPRGLDGAPVKTDPTQVPTA